MTEKIRTFLQMISFREEFPESKYNKELERMAQHARDYLDRNNKDNNE